MDEFEEDEAEEDGYEDEDDEAGDDDDEPQNVAMAYESRTKSGHGRLKTMQLQRYELAQEKAAERMADKATRGDSAVENVKAILIHHHQSVVAGWRKAIDHTSTHRVGKLAFCKALRELGCKENLNAVWIEFGGKKGHLTLADLDDAAAQILSAFYRGFSDKINSRIHSLVEHVDSLRIDCKVFQEKCKLLSTTLELEDVFKALRLDIPFITAADLAWLEQYCERGHKAEPAQTAEDKARAEAREESLAKAAQRKAVKDFRMLCHHRFGGVIAAWREVLDPQGRGRLPSEDLRKGAIKLGFTGDVDVLWEALAGDGYVVELEDLEPASAEALNSFKKSCIARFGSMKTAFRELMAKEMPLVTRDEFVRWCKEVRSDKGSDKLLWRYLDEQNLGKINIHAIDEDAAEEVCGKENLDTANEIFGALEPLPKKAPAMTLIEREVKKQQENPAKVSSAEARSMHKALLDMFNTKYGSTVRAWKIGLDTKGAGKLSQDEFFLGCSVLGYRGNLHEVWSLLGLKPTSHIRLRDLDPSTGEDVRQFRERCIDRFGTVHDALQKVSKTKKSKGNARVNEEEFYKLCKLMNIECPYKKLWTHLDPTRRGVVSTKSVGWLTNIPDTDERALARHLCQMVEQQKAKREQRQIDVAAATCHTAKDQKKKSDAHREKKQSEKELFRKRDKLLKMLSVDYKAIGRGWVIAMDPDRNLTELALDDFFAGLERLGMLNPDADDDELARAEDLFKLFDPEGTGVITLDRFDRGLTTEALNDLRYHLVERYGSLVMAFVPHIEANLIKHASEKKEEEEEEEEENDDEANVLTCISVGAFRHMCQEAKFTSAVHRLIMFLDPYETNRIDLSFIDEEVATEALDLATEEKQRKDRYAKGRRRKYPHMLREDIRVGVPCGVELRDRVRETRDAAKALKEFKKQCINKYGSLVKAWRELLNPEGEEDTIGFDAFSEACGQLGLEDSAEAAWAALGCDTLSLRALDENIDKDLIEFNARIVERYASIDNAIDETDTDDIFEMDYTAFSRLLFEAQFRRNERRLFEYFGGIYKDKKSVISFMDIDAEAVERVKQKRKEDEERRQLEKGIDPKQKKPPKKRLSRDSEQTAGEDDEQEDSQSEGGKRRQSQNVKVVAPQRAGEDPAVSFRAFLCRRFGTIRRAWRVIDVQKQAALTKSEFSSACRVVGFGGSATNVWNACGCKELLCLRDLDPDGWQLLARYRKLFVKRLGILENAFDGTTTLDYDSFSEICKKIECPKPWDTLFDILDIKCQGVISWDDMKFLDEDFDWHRGVPLRKCAIPLGGTRSLKLPNRVRGMGNLCTTMKPNRVMLATTNSLPNISPGLRPNWNDRHNVLENLSNKTDNLIHIMKYVNVQDEIRISRRVAKKILKVPTHQLIQENIHMSNSYEDDEDDGWNNTRRR